MSVSWNLNALLSCLDTEGQGFPPLDSGNYPATLADLRPWPQTKGWVLGSHSSEAFELELLFLLVFYCFWLTSSLLLHSLHDWVPSYVCAVCGFSHLSFIYPSSSIPSSFVKITLIIVCLSVIYHLLLSIYLYVYMCICKLQVSYCLCII